MAPGAGLLEGVRVLDLSRVLAGPFAAQIMADLGADVVKVELPQGDPAREIGPFLDGRSLYFSSVNSGKRGVMVDPSSPSGRSELEALLGWADVVVENFRPSAAQELGLEPGALLGRHPRLVVVTVSSYARSSSRAEDGAFDVTVQAESGIMGVTGEEGRPPVRAGVAIGDLGASLWAVIGATSALFVRERDGHGRHIEVPLLDATLPLLSYMATAAMAGSVEPPRVGSGHHSVTPYGAFATEDGWVVVAVLADKFWEPFCVAVGLQDLAARVDLRRGDGRLLAREEVESRVASAFAGFTTEACVTRLGGAGIPHAPVLGILAALGQPYVRDRGIVEGIDTPEGSYCVIRSPLRSVRRLRPAPSLGEHTREVLAEVLGKGLSVPEMSGPRRNGTAGSAVDFELSVEHQAFRDSLREFVDREIRPVAREWEQAGRYPTEIVDGLKQLGLFGLTVPEEYGGLGADTVVLALTFEEISRGWMGIAGVLGTHTLACATVARHGTEEQRRAYLPQLATGERRSGVALTEPGAGSDLQGITTRARRDGDAYVLSGTKTWITNARHADPLLVLAKTDPSAVPRHAGMSLFLVEAGTPGVEVSRDLPKLGYKGPETCEVVFDDARLSADALLGGEEGLGFQQIAGGLEVGRINIAARAVGVAQEAFDRALAYAREREAFGKPIGEHQAIQLKLADMATEVQAARLLTWWAAWKYDRGERADLEAGMAKYFSSEVALRAALESMRVHGGYGYSEEYEVARLYRDAPLMAIGEGTNEIQRTLIARRLLRGLAPGG